jgi:parallel beta-helix repeat protein
MMLATVRKLFGAAAKPGRRPDRRYRPEAEALEGRVLLSHRVFTVDDDRVQCPTADFTSINAAVAAASPGDTIRVCPGQYNESVQVNKTLTLEARPGEADRNPTRTPNPQRDAIVQPPAAGSSGFLVTADDVVIDGFVVQGTTNNAGINLDRQHSGYQVRDNLIRDNTFGLYLNTNGARRTVIDDNAFVNNNRPGSAAGNGIYSDQGVSNARITDNFFTKQTNAALIFVGDGTAAQDQFNLQIRENTMIDDAPVILVNAHDAVIRDNVSLRSAGSGIFFGGNVRNVTVSDNVLRDGAFTGINLRTNAFGNAPQANTNNRITDNVVRGFGDSGIRLREGASGNLVAGNRVSDNGKGNDPTTGDGISLENAQNNVVRDNRSRNNRRDGIRVDALSAGNRIVGNRLRHNGEHDAHDDSIGSGTAGTANLWEHNFCKTENRPGLCEHHHHGDDGDDDDDD